MAFSLNNLFSAFSSSKPTQGVTAVGIDVGSASVKIVEVTDKDGALRLATYGELQLGPYGDAPLGAAVSLPLEKRIEAVVDVLREANSKATAAVVTVQLTQSFVTNITLAAKEDEDIAPRVPVEARKVIPTPLSDVALEWVELPPLGESNELVREVLVAAIQKSAIDETKKVLEGLQKQRSNPEIEVFSTIRALLTGEEQAVAIIDLGARTNKLYLVEGGYLRRLHRVQAGGSLATERLADLLSLEFAEAENLKRNFVTSSEAGTDIKKAVLSTYERTFQEFKRAISKYEDHGGAVIEGVILTGGAAAFPEFASFASYTLDRPAQVAHPFGKVSYPAFMEDTVKEIGPSFSVALGGALRYFE